MSRANVKFIKSEDDDAGPAATVGVSRGKRKLEPEPEPEPEEEDEDDEGGNEDRVLKKGAKITYSYWKVDGEGKLTNRVEWYRGKIASMVKSGKDKQGTWCKIVFSNKHVNSVIGKNLFDFSLPANSARTKNGGWDWA